MEVLREAYKGKWGKKTKTCYSNWANCSLYGKMIPVNLENCTSIMKYKRDIDRGRGYKVNDVMIKI